MINGTNGVSGQMIKDSISPEGVRLSTVHLRYPRMIHSEIMTHRVFSRNGRSSRAVPVATLLKEDHYTPYFMKNQPGMVASEEMDRADWLKARHIWDNLAEYTKEAVAELNKLGVHKQWANRPLEAFGYIDVLISSTDWANFMALRDEDGAQPEIDSVAKMIKQLMNNSTPSLLQPGQWHLPYIEASDYEEATDHLKDWWYEMGTSKEDRVKSVLYLLQKISVARCARLTIRPFDGDSSIDKEVNRYERLMVSRPVHASPAEHIATPDTHDGAAMKGVWHWQHEKEHGNFYGWRQFRKLIPHNTVEESR